VRQTGCDVVGAELYAEAVMSGADLALKAGLEARARFVQADCSQPLPFEGGSFDAIVCIDAINHLPGRQAVLTEWARLLRNGGRLCFTDPLTVTGSLGSDEIAIRTSIGYGLFLPVGENERLLEAAGLSLVTVEDTTESKAVIARRRHDARAHHEVSLREIEGDQTFFGRQRFFDTAAKLAGERRLSRYAYVAAKPT
jgi:SAM-dependent methyltransferase